ncbi:MAG: hypothetical protein ABR505_08390 [Actinomycetota bacterium]
MIEAPRSSPLRVVARAALLLIIVVFGFFYLMLAAGGASFIHECDTLLCGQLHQAIFAAIGGVSLFIAAYRAYSREPSAAKIAFFGTLPILVVHVVLVIADPNESIFFPISTTPPPVVSGVLLLFRRG